MNSIESDFSDYMQILTDETVEAGVVEAGAGKKRYLSLSDFAGCNGENSVLSNSNKVINNGKSDLQCDSSVAESGAVNNVPNIGKSDLPGVSSESFVSFPFKLLVAFSGGVDSLALLILAVKTLGKERVYPVYVNHNLRTARELDKEIKLNRENCERLGVPLTIKTIKSGEIKKQAKEFGGTESSARASRYGILQQTALELGAKYIATAHHANDQTETILMRIVYGGTLASLRGISYKIDNVIRPLLDFSKQDLQTYVMTQGFIWSTDSTNSDNSIRRNYLRNIIIPSLPFFLSDYEVRLNRIRKNAIKMCLHAKKYSEYIPVSDLKLLNDMERTLTLYSLWNREMPPYFQMPESLSKRVIESLDKQYAEESSNGGTFLIYRSNIYMINNYKITEYHNYEKKLSKEVCKVSLLNGTLEVSEKGTDKNLLFDFRKLGNNIYARYVRTDDRIKLKNGSKTVLKLLQEQKIPQILRHRVPVLAERRENGEKIIAVFGSSYGGRDRICSELLSSDYGKEEKDVKCEGEKFFGNNGVNSCCGKEFENISGSFEKKPIIQSSGENLNYEKKSACEDSLIFKKNPGLNEISDYTENSENRIDNDAFNYGIYDKINSINCGEKHIISDKTLTLAHFALYVYFIKGKF